MLHNWMENERVWEPQWGPKEGVYVISLILFLMCSRKQILNLLLSSLYLHFQESERNSFVFWEHTILWAILASSCTPYIAMSSFDDYKVIMKTSSLLCITRR